MAGGQFLRELAWLARNMGGVPNGPRVCLSVPWNMHALDGCTAVWWLSRNGEDKKYFWCFIRVSMLHAHG
jgi:hypothetical protein